MLERLAIPDDDGIDPQAVSLPAGAERGELGRLDAVVHHLARALVSAAALVLAAIAAGVATTALPDGAARAAIAAEHPAPIQAPAFRAVGARTVAPVVPRGEAAAFEHVGRLAPAPRTAARAVLALAGRAAGIAAAALAPTRALAFALAQAPAFVFSPALARARAARFAEAEIPAQQHLLADHLGSPAIGVLVGVRVKNLGREIAEQAAGGMLGPVRFQVVIEAREVLGEIDGAGAGTARG